jgi:hypothetical protein
VSAEVDGATRAERTVEERNIALEEFLTVISQNAAFEGQRLAQAGVQPGSSRL